MSFKVNYEGITYVIDFDEDGEPFVTNEVILPVNAQMYSHIKETLERILKEGTYAEEINNAIEQGKESLVL